MKTIKALFKTVLAGLAALAILSVLMFGYYFMPLRENNPKQNTDYVWAPNTLWASLTEGISYGITDADGFINPEVIENPDILFLGSSHLQAMSVMPGENMCSLLNEQFSGEYRAYNMGISGHTIYKVVQYLDASLNVYQKAPKYIIIETSDVALNEQYVKQALSGEVKKTEVVDTGFIAQLQKVPYFRQMYHQLDSGMLKMLLPDNKKKAEPLAANTNQAANEKPAINEKPFDEMLGYLQKMEKEYNTQIIVMFHPFETINADGTIGFSQADHAKVFSQYAEKYAIGFVDMTNDFETMYDEEHHVPHGFATGETGVGHLNRYGHAAIAESLYQYIRSMEVE